MPTDAGHPRALTVAGEAGMAGPHSTGYWSAWSGLPLFRLLGFPVVSVVKNPPTNTGDDGALGPIPGPKCWHIIIHVVQSLSSV